MGRRLGVAGGAALMAGLGLAAATGGGLAQETVNLPSNYQLGLQDAATPVMEGITWMHDSVLLPIITVITLLVLGLLVIVMVRFNARSNPTPSRTTHNTTVEVLWTVVPIVILIAIAIPSFKLLYLQRVLPEADMTIKAVGHQWYWSYEYPDHGEFTFDSLMLEDDERGAGQPRLFAVDNPVVVPQGQVIRVQVTADDVIHDWAVPAFGLKMDAIPGRLNETWFKADKAGTYYGMCSELCGVRHAYMPIEVRVLAEAEFNRWVEQAQAEFAAAPHREGEGDRRTAAVDEAGRQAN
jgi:cytochrome c oxidase subunit 2